MIDSPLAFPSGAYGHPGMTLRDYFAAQAMQASVEALFRDKPHNADRAVELAAFGAYKIADAMLKARGE